LSFSPFITIVVVTSFVSDGAELGSVDGFTLGESVGTVDNEGFIEGRGVGAELRVGCDDGALLGDVEIVGI
jgi:hypothetical protein